jgi:hypothetical protein
LVELYTVHHAIAVEICCHELALYRRRLEEEEEEEEEDLFVFNDTIEGPRAPAVKPGRITQAWMTYACRCM